MTLHTLAVELRKLAVDLQAKGQYDPHTDSIADRTPSGTTCWQTLAPDRWHPIAGARALLYHIFPLLLRGRNEGAFDGQPEMKRRISAVSAFPEGDSVSSVLEELELNGTNCWGLDPHQGSIERLADAFDSFGVNAMSVKGRRATIAKRFQELSQETTASGAAAYTSQEAMIQKLQSELGVSRATIMADLMELRNKGELPQGPKARRATRRLSKK